MRFGTRLGFKQGVNVEFLDIGVNIDCPEFTELDSQLSMRIEAEITSPAGSADKDDSAMDLTSLRRNQWESVVIFALRKEISIFSSDDLTERNTLLEV